MENQAQTVTHEPDVTACDLEDIFAEIEYRKLPSLDVLLEMLEDEADNATSPKGWKGVYQNQYYVTRIRALVEASRTIYREICRDVYSLERAVDEGVESLERLATRLCPERTSFLRTVIVFASGRSYEAYMEDAIVCAAELREPIFRHGLAPCYLIEDKEKLDSLTKKLDQKGWRVKVLKADGETDLDTVKPSAGASCTKSDGSCEGCGAQAQ